MPTNYPGALDSFPSAATLAAHQLSTDPHSTLHGNLGASVLALETQVGTTGAFNFALTANNLSDLANASAARTNLGLGTAATHAATDFALSSTTVNGHALNANVTVTASDVGLGSVTNDAQTKAAIVPNTAPSPGQILVGNAGGTAYAPVAMSSDATLASTGAITIANSAVTTVKIAANAVTNAKMATGSANSLAGYDGSGNFSGVTVGSGLSLSLGTLTATGGGSGTVTSFSAGNLSPLFTTSVATATTTPALSFTLTNQSANLVYAGPSTGAAAAPTFRSLVVADLPTGIPNANLANSSVTINGAGGITGGGAVSLGGSLTLTGTAYDALSSLVNSPNALTNPIAATLTAGTWNVITAMAACNAKLPAPSAGKVIGVRVANASTNLFTLNPNSTEKIQPGANTSRIMWAGESAVLVSDGTDWIKVAGLTIPMTCTCERASTNLAITWNSIGVYVPLDTNTDGIASMYDGTGITTLRAGVYQVNCFIYAVGGTPAAGAIGAASASAPSSWLTGYQFQPVASGVVAGSFTTQVRLAASYAVRLSFQPIAGSGTGNVLGPAQPAILQVTEIPSW